MEFHKIGPWSDLFREELFHLHPRGLERKVPHLYRVVVPVPADWRAEGVNVMINFRRKFGVFSCQPMLRSFYCVKEQHFELKMPNFEYFLGEIKLNIGAGQ
jgi:hypothetical protein